MLSAQVILEAQRCPVQSWMPGLKVSGEAIPNDVQEQVCSTANKWIDIDIDDMNCIIWYDHVFSIYINLMVVDIAGTWVDVPFFYHPRRDGHSRVQEINGNSQGISSHSILF